MPKNKRKITAILVTVGAMLLAYARWVEPSWIEVTRHQVIADIEQPLKILQLSDLHTYEFGAREKRVVEIIRHEKPDVVVVSGDTVANEGDWKSVGILLSRLRAPLGVYLVRGNWEHWKPDPDELRVYESSGVTFLHNDARRLFGNAWLVGLDDSAAGFPDQNQAFAKVPRDAFVISLFHSPAYFDSIASRIDLGLSGHTHGGQMRIPFLPPLWLPDGSGAYVAGWYAQEGSAKMYVSRGVGNSVIEMRFACRPEIAVFQLEPHKK